MVLCDKSSVKPNWQRKCLLEFFGGHSLMPSPFESTSDSLRFTERNSRIATVSKEEIVTLLCDNQTQYKHQNGNETGS